jgi:hypothetical protein
VSAVAGGCCRCCHRCCHRCCQPGRCSGGLRHPGRRGPWALLSVRESGNERYVFGINEAVDVSNAERACNSRTHDSYARGLRTPGKPPESPGFVSRLALLLDVQFERRFGAVLVRWLYVASLAMVAAVTVFGMLTAWWLASWVGWGFWMGMPIAVAGGLMWALGIRLVCEQLIRWMGPEQGRVHAADTLARVSPCAVVPPCGKRARPYGWWSSRPGERPTPKRPVVCLASPGMSRRG